MTNEQLTRLEKMHAETQPSAPAEIYQWFPELAKALREALARCDTLRGLADEKAYEAGLYGRRMEEAQESRRMMRAAAANFEKAWKEAVAERDAALSELRLTKAFHDVAVKERDYERVRANRIEKERDEARKWLEGICSEFEGAVAHADWRAAGSKGMSVPFTGDFADMTRHPGVIGRMRWWVKVFRAVLNGEQP